MTISCWILPRMRNVPNKSCRENQSTHYISLVIFSRKSCRVWDKCRKMWWSQRGRRWKYGGMLHSGLVRLHAPVLPHPYTHALTHPHSYKHTEICTIYCFFTATHFSVSLHAHFLYFFIPRWVTCVVDVYKTNQVIKWYAQPEYVRAWTEAILSPLTGMAVGCLEPCTVG